jgi:5-(carboxyamino)imidazole ribonucleotide synthase
VEYAIIRNTQDLHQGINALGSQIILKASRDGYDGYGQWRVESQDDLSNILPELEKLDLQAVPLIAEKFVPFQREISLIGVRNQNGEVKVYPMAENLHHKGQLHLSVAPANALTADLQTQAQEAFEKISTKLNYVGVLAIEFFQLDDRLLVNELAPRVHNSGHWTQQGSPTSQFENHLRAICGLPLGETHCVAPTAMINLIGYLPSTKDILSQPNCHLHLYGKTIRPKRKVGHVNVSGEKKSLLVQKMNELAKKLPNEHFPVLLDGINMQKQG